MWCDSLYVTSFVLAKWLWARAAFFICDTFPLLAFPWVLGFFLIVHVFSLLLIRREGLNHRFAVILLQNQEQLLEL